MRSHIHWAALMSGHLLATVSIWNPQIHINLPQFATEARSKTPLRERGWQDALESVYPFKINRLAIHDGDIIYIDREGSKPLHLANLNFITGNIRNVNEPTNVYPSRLSGSMTVFGSGRLAVDGRANYLMKPFPGVAVNYSITNVPLSSVTPASQHLNIFIRGGILSSNGTIEYSPRVTNVKLRNATVDSIELSYIHLAQTRVVEQQRVTEAGEAVEKQNNRPSVNVDVRELDLRNSRLDFKNYVSDPRYELFITDTNMRLRNLSNHAEHGLSNLDLEGKFMGSGATRISGTFWASPGGPEFTTRIEIVNTQLTALNPLMRAYGRIDVAHGYLTVYSQIGVKNNRIGGYVKPMFSDIEVYSYAKDRNKGALQQVKNLLVGAAAHLLKNRKTQEVASQVNLTGELKDPRVSAWQGLVEAIRNAFVQAILPGFDRQVTSRHSRISPY